MFKNLSQYRLVGARVPITASEYTKNLAKLYAALLEIADGESQDCQGGE